MYACEVMAHPELTKREAVDRLLAVWEANPRLSLGQLWQRATRGVSIAYLFDDELVQLLELQIEGKKARNTSAAVKSCDDDELIRLLELEMPKPKPVLKRAYRKQ